MELSHYLDDAWAGASLETNLTPEPRFDEDESLAAYDKYEDLITGPYAGTHRLSAYQVKELYLALPAGVDGVAMHQATVQAVLSQRVRVIEPSPKILEMRKRRYDAFEQMSPIERFRFARRRYPDGVNPFYVEQDDRLQDEYFWGSCSVDVEPYVDDRQNCVDPPHGYDEEAQSKARKQEEFEREREMTDEPTRYHGSWHLLPAERYPSNAVEYELGGRELDLVTGLGAKLAIIVADLEYYMDRELYGARHG